MPQWLTDFLMGPEYTMGSSIWNMIMMLIYGTITKTPQAFSSTAWAFVTDTLYPWALGIGIALLNIFFMIGFFREASNLKENVTWEILMMYGMKLVLANGLMTGGLTIIQQFFSMAGKLGGQVMTGSLPAFSTTDIDLGSYLFFKVFGILYAIVAIVCGIIMLFTVYGRYLKLYILTAMAPIALSTMAGGRGMEQSAYAWIKNFLACVFEIVIVAITMTIGGMMMQHLDFGAASTLGIWSFGDGSLQCLQNLFTMVIMTGAVKGADTFLRRSFAL